MCAFCLTLLVPSLYLPIREVLQPWAIARVKAEHDWLIWLQKYHHPAVEYVFQLIGLQCGIGFYITALPFLFWIGEMRLVYGGAALRMCLPEAKTGRCRPDN